MLEHLPVGAALSRQLNLFGKISQSLYRIILCSKVSLKFTIILILGSMNNIFHVFHLISVVVTGVAAGAVAETTEVVVVVAETMGVGVVVVVAETMGVVGVRATALCPPRHHSQPTWETCPTVSYKETYRRYLTTWT